MQAIKDARVESEKDDKMAALENKTKDSKMEMEILDGVAIVRIAYSPSKGSMEMEILDLRGAPTPT
jgi:hypothetical protein